MVHISIYKNLEEEEIASFGKIEIEGLEIKMAKDKSRDLISTIVLAGKILVPDKNKEEDKEFKQNQRMRKKLFGWSKSYDTFEISCIVLYYRNEIINGNKVREYKASIFDEVYLVDYAEDFDGENGVGRFHLILRQKKNSQMEYIVNEDWGRLVAEIDRKNFNTNDIDEVFLKKLVDRDKALAGCI